MTDTLARKLGLSFAVTGLGAALLTALLVNLAFGGRFDSYLDQQRSGRERQLASAFAAAYDEADGWRLDRLDRLAPLTAMAGAEVRLLDTSDRPVWSAANSQMGPEMAQMHREMTSAGPLAPESAVPVVVGGDQVGTLLVRLPEGTVPLADRQFRRSVNVVLLTGGLVAGLVALTVGFVLARRTTRPVTELTAAAEDLRAGNRTRRAAVSGNDEIGQLAQAFNELADSVQREDAVRRSFTADVAHELRTPLTILRSHLEGVQDGVTLPSPALVTSLHEETLRLERLVADLETMASADGVVFSLHRQPLDLSAVVASAARALDHRFTEQSLTLDLRLDPAPVSGDGTRLRQVVTNLLTNALKFVPPGGTVTVLTGVEHGRAVMSVSDDGPGIPREEMHRVFERFYRGRRSRAGGSGIGLAVVASLVRAHGGDVDVTSAPDHGARFCVRLPLSSGTGVRPGRPSSDLHSEPIPSPPVAAGDTRRDSRHANPQAPGLR